MGFQETRGSTRMTDLEEIGNDHAVMSTATLGARLIRPKISSTGRFVMRPNAISARADYALFEQNSFARILSGTDALMTGPFSSTWVDHLILPASDEAALREAGYR